MKDKEYMAYRACFDTKRKFGIELEGFGFSRPEVVEALEQEKVLADIGDTFSKSSRKWVVSQDGTIKYTYPIEIISPILSGHSGLDQVERVCAAVNRLGLKTAEGSGFHIHWNVSDYTGRSMIGLLRLYGKYERILDFIFDDSRRDDNNPYACSLVKFGGIEWVYGLSKPSYYHAYQIAREFEETQETENTTSRPTARHHKVNICAYNKYGTVEFRQHHGTFDFEEIKYWILLSQQLVSRAKDTVVFDGIATWESLMRTLALTDAQLSEWVETPDKNFLREMKEFYRKIYRENRIEQEKF